MKRKFEMSKDMARAVTLAVGAVSALSAQAATLYGGGATLPAVGYEGKTAALGTVSSPATRLSSPTSNPADSASLFGVVSGGFGFDISYCQTGSGTGKRVLGGVSGYAASNSCSDFNNPAPLGFSAPSGTLDPDFAASDAPMAQSEYNAVISSWGSSHSAPVQFPVAAGAIGILYQNSSLTSAPVLTDTQICKIFSGQFTNWSQIDSSFTSKALHVVYRSDGSGTTFSLTNHLSAVCGSLGALPAGEHYITDQTFTTAYGSIGTIPSFFTAASGNPGVVSVVYASGNDGYIGYGEIADAIAHNASATYAKVKNRTSGANTDPLADLPGTLAITTTTGQVIASVDSSGRPALAAITGSPGASQSACVMLAVPSSYADPAGGYPILAVTNLLGYYNHNRQPSDVIELLASTYNTDVQSGVTSIGSGTGLAYVSTSAISTWSGDATDAPAAIANCVH